jgi:asparagine synthase (glutamine-hydrolysing)
LLASRGESLIALTGVPLPAYRDPDPNTVRGDESRLAAVLAAHYPNIDHVRCRASRSRLFDFLDRCSSVSSAPMRGLNNLPWQRTALKEASLRDVSVCLRGGHGNWSISAGGQMMFSDALAENGVPTTLRAAKSYARNDPRLWWNVIHFIAGPLLLKRLYRFLFELRGQPLTATSAPFLKQPFRGQVETVRRRQQEDLRPVRSFKALIRTYFAEWADNENVFAALTPGLEMRDPTSDRRVVDHILAQPAEFFISQKDRRPLYEAAFGDDVPVELLLARPIGMPGEDWNLVYDPAGVAEAFRGYSTHPIVAEVIDTAAALDALQSWPSGAPTLDQYRIYVQELLNSLSLASFISVRFAA